MLQPTPIETELGLNLDGTFTRLDVWETTPTNVSHVIQTTTASGVLGEVWGVNLEWEINSQLAGNPHHFLLLPLNWKVQVFLEGLGPGAIEFELPAPPAEHLVNYGAGVNVNPNSRTWATTLTFTPPAVTIPEGLYKLGVALTLQQPGGAGPAPAAGFVEGPLVQFYEPGP